MTLSPLTLDEPTLALIETALEARFTVDDDGTHHLIGEFSMGRLLEFWSGYDRDRSVLVGYAGDTPIYEHLDPLYSEHDLIRALVAEIRRLRKALA